MAADSRRGRAREAVEAGAMAVNSRRGRAREAVGPGPMAAVSDQKRYWIPRANW